MTGLRTLRAQVSGADQIIIIVMSVMKLQVISRASPTNEKEDGALAQFRHDLTHNKEDWMALLTQDQRIALAEKLERMALDPKVSDEKKINAARSARQLRNLWACTERKKSHISPATRNISVH